MTQLTHKALALTLILAALTSLSACEFKRVDGGDTFGDRTEPERENNNGGGGEVTPTPPSEPTLQIEDGLGAGPLFWGQSISGNLSICGELDENRKLRVTKALDRACPDGDPMLIFGRSDGGVDITPRSSPEVDIVGGRGGEISESGVIGAPDGESRVNLLVWQNGDTDFAAEITIEYVFRPANANGNGEREALFVYLYTHHF